MTQVQIIAHRGLTSQHLENTLSALTSAFDSGADGVEFDVQLSKDQIPMVFHDRGLRRLVNKKANIDDLTGAELSKLSQRSKKYNNFRYAISTLNEVLSAMPANKLINIELKETTGLKGFDGMREVLKVIEPYKNKLNIVISSFDPEILHMVSKLDINYAIGLLIDKESTLEAFINGAIILDRIDFLHPHIDLVNKINFKKLKDPGMQLIIWGHKKMGQEVNFFGDNYAALISDIPEALIKNK